MMKEYILSKKSNCTNCYKCIRNCPVKSIRFSSGQAVIIPEECVLCGECYAVCPKGAKAARDDLAFAKSLLGGEAPVYASIDPSFVAAFDQANISSLRAALTELGFAGAFECAEAATIVKNEYQRILEEDRPPVLISSQCPSINALIQKFYPEAVPYLAPVMTPMQIHSRMIKKEHPGAKVIFVGPCVADKAECDNYPGYADCAITFRELMRWLGEARIRIQSVDEEKCDETLGRAFPTSGGILHTMQTRLPEYDYLVIDGVQNCKDAIEDIISEKLSNCFVEMAACPGSCIGSPIIDKTRRSRVRNYQAVSRYTGTKDFPVNSQGMQLKKAFAPDEQKRQTPTKEQIQEILGEMGKVLPEHELNCGACGYDTCRQKATAVFQGKADITMCLPFLKEKAESFSDNIINNTPNGIVVVNEDLEVLQINKAAKDIMNIKYEGDILGDQIIRILDPTLFYEVIESGHNIHEQRVYLAEYRKYVELSIVYDHSFHLLICIMRDVTAEERSREMREKISRQTIDVTDKVIEKQMRVVQEIASLLGETTAETKVALTKLKESLSNGGD